MRRVGEWMAETGFDTDMERVFYDRWKGVESELTRAILEKESLAKEVRALREQIRIRHLAPPPRSLPPPSIW